MNTEKIMEDIQSVQDNIREIKSTLGNTIMTLDNIKSGLKADVQKKVDEAYQRGHDDGYEAGCATAFKPVSDTEYQRGLNDAWEAVKKIALMDTETSENVTGYFGLFRIMENLTPMQAIEKLKAYEDKQKDRIEVGDFVRSNEFRDIVVCVTYVDAEWKNFSGFAITDTQACRKGHAFASCRMDRWHKTGEHFDIEPLWKGES